MATIGGSLLKPESEWKRYDDTDGCILYSNGTWTRNENHADCYNQTKIHCPELGATITFKLKGNAFRIIGTLYPSFSSNIEVNIDNEIIESFSEVNPKNVYVGAILVYEKLGLREGIHTITLTNKTSASMQLDAIDTMGELIPVLSKQYEFPVGIIDENDVEEYAAELIYDEEQLLITRDGNLYLTKGDGTYIPVGSNGSSADVPNEDSHSHENKEIIDKFNETNGNLLYDGKIIGNGNQDGSADIEINALKTDVKNIKKVIENYDIDEDGIIDNAKNIKGIEDAHYLTYYGRDINGNIGFHSFPVVTYEQGSINQAVKLNVTPSSSYAIDLANTNPNGDFIIQCFKFISGEKNVSQTLKEFNNGDNLNFFYDNENVNFNGTINIKDEHNIESSVINTNSFVEIYEIMEEQYE